MQREIRAKAQVYVDSQIANMNAKITRAQRSKAIGAIERVLVRMKRQRMGDAPE
jgi:hypothetical protein